MATYFLSLNTSCTLPLPSTTFVKKERRCQRIKCIQEAINKEMEVPRRTANYLPSICDYDFIQSLRSDYGDTTYTRQAENLKNYAKSLLEEEKDTLSSLELIDTLQRLGVSYLFDEEIKQVIEERLMDTRKQDDLYYTALKFRILRQHGHMAPQDEFVHLLDKNGCFKEALSKDTKAVLSLYDASYLAMEGETIMDDARAFSTKQLKDHTLKRSIKSELHEHIEHGLEIPYYWRPQRLEARWFSDAYARNEKKNPKLLELAKLDYNIRQARYQTNAKAMSRWWKDCGLAEQLPFFRDRLPECLIWGVGIIYGPQYGHAVEGLTLVNQFITILDDLYDVYGTIEELELFTNAVERWDLQVLEELPGYMRTCYLALFNLVNEMGYTALKNQGLNIIPFLKKIWGDLCKSYFMEAKWFYQGYKPTFDEYIKNACVSISVPVVISSGFVLMNQGITKDRMSLFLPDNYPDLIHASSLALRLIDDLGTSNDELSRGDVPKAVQCYMHEKGVSEEVAREHVKHMVSESWKTMNKNLVLGSSLPRDVVISAMDFVRMAQWYYVHGDGFGLERTRTLDAFKSLVAEPI